MATLANRRCKSVYKPENLKDRRMGGPEVDGIKQTEGS